MPAAPACVGACPRPAYVPHMAWFQGGAQTGEADAAALLPGEMQAILDRAAREVVTEQDSIGINIPTDGEIRRANYIHHHCAHIDPLCPP